MSTTATDRPPSTRSPTPSTTTARRFRRPTPEGCRRGPRKCWEAGEYTQALVDRLKLSDAKLDSIVEMVRSVAAQDDPLGKTLEARELDENLELYKLAVPIGVVGTVFESRPDALVQIAALP